MNAIDPSYFERLLAFLQREVVPWLIEVQENPIPGSTIAGEWPLPEFEDAANVTASLDDNRMRITVSLKRTGQILTTMDIEGPVGG